MRLQEESIYNKIKVADVIPTVRVLGDVKLHTPRRFKDVKALQPIDKSQFPNTEHKKKVQELYELDQFEARVIPDELPRVRKVAGQ